MADIEQSLSRSQRRALKTMNALMLAGEEVLGANGFQQVTIAEITECADVALGSFYNYFENRDAIIEAVLQEAFRSQLMLSRFVLGDDSSPTRRFTAGFAAQIHRVRLDPRWAAFTDMAALARLWPDSYWKKRAAEEIRAGVADGSFRVEDQAWALKMLLAASRTLLDPVVRERFWSLDEELGTVLTTVLQLVGADEPLIVNEIRWAREMQVDHATIAFIRAT